jgi:hypothetical protein
VPDYRVKISEKSDHNALQNLSSNPTANFSEFYNNYVDFLKKIEKYSMVWLRSTFDFGELRVLTQEDF